MRHLRFVGLCLVAVFAFGAVSAASASAAEPALYECAKAGKETVEWKEGAPGKEKTKKKAVYTGGYLDKKCTEATSADVYRIKGAHPGPEGKYELQEGVGKGKEFKGKGAGADLETPVGEVRCTSSADAGKFTGPKTGYLTATFKSCATLGHKCNSVGAATGEIKTEELEGEVGYISGGGGSSPRVGVDLKPKTGSVMALFTCNPEELHLRVTGSVIGEVEPTYNRFTKEATVKLLSSSGHQAIEKMEGGVKDTLLEESLFGGTLPVELEPEASRGASAEKDVVTNKGEELMLKACATSPCS